MTKLTQRIIYHPLEGEATTTNTYHIYSTGYFVRDGHKEGWHISGQDEHLEANYTEDLSIQHGYEIPDSLPDIDIYESEDEPEDPDAEATVADYEAVIKEVFGDDD